jgi:beta-glucosidase
VQPRTVVILHNGSAVAMSAWIDGVAAVLEAWMMGQAGGGAIADILYGVVNPSGKLAETFPLRLADTPAYLNFPGDNGQVRYGEGCSSAIATTTPSSAGALPLRLRAELHDLRLQQPRASRRRSFRDVDGVTVSAWMSPTRARSPARRSCRSTFTTAGQPGAPASRSSRALPR